MGDEILLRTECIPIQIMDGSLLPPPIHLGGGIVFDQFLCFFLCFVSKITRKQLDRFA